MIISNNNKPPLNKFEKLMGESISFLNEDALVQSDYYKNRGGVKLEEDIYKVMVDKAQGTIFENTIQLISNQRFPDIVASQFYGVEVKTSKGKNWTSTGSSIVESTRVEDVERIFMLFGQLSDPVEFRVKRYEDCLSDIVVTHSPRYKIDMQLSSGETIFEKMNVKYDEFRQDADSIGVVKDYYKSQLKPKQKLWWLDTESVEEKSVSPIVRLWSSLEKVEKEALLVKGLAWFPEIFSNSRDKYNNYALWLVTHQAVLSTSLRDPFTAGGQGDIVIGDNIWESKPQVFSKLLQYKEELVNEIENAEEDLVEEFWGISLNAEGRIAQWINVVIDNIAKNKQEIREMLYKIFEL